MGKSARAVVGVTAVVCLLAACGGRGGTDDGGGGDGGPGGGPIRFRTCDPVMVDAGPPPDLGTPAMCFGTPSMDCATRPVATCAMGMGCTVTQCRGFPIACNSLNAADCMTQTGCTWAGTLCIGVGTPCTSIAAMDTCTAHMGCVWSAMMSCGGITTPCGMLDAATCASQPGCTTTNPDAGTPMRDAGLPTCTGCMGTVPVDVRVMKAPEPLQPFGGVKVHFESTCGASMDVTTGMDGRAHAMLDRAQGRWTMTAATAGYGATSVVGVSEFEFDGDVRLDPTTFPMATPVGVTGMVTGAPSGAMVRIDAPDFDTTAAGAGGTFMSSFYLQAWPVPLRFCATVLDPMTMEAQNQVCSPETTRGAMPIAGITLPLASPAPMPTITTVAVDLPTTGLLTAGAAMPLTAPAAQHVFALQGDPYVFVGSSAWEPAMNAVVIRSFPDLPVNLAVQSFGIPTNRLNVELHAPFPARVTVPPADVLDLSGSTLADSAVTGGGTGWDVVVWDLGEDEMGGLAHWRVFAPLDGATPATFGVPHLPAGVTTSDVGFTGPTESIALLVKMNDGRVWSSRLSNGPVREWALGFGGQYTPLDPSGR